MFITAHLKTENIQRVSKELNTQTHKG